MTKMWPKSAARAGNLCIHLGAYFGGCRPKPPLRQLVYFNLSTDAVTIHVPCNIQTRGNVESVSTKCKLAKISPSFFHNFFAALTTVHHSDTRPASRGDIFMTRKNTLQYGLRSVRFAGAKSWNSISDNIRKSPSIFIFCRKFKSHIFSTKYQV